MEQNWPKRPTENRLVGDTSSWIVARTQLGFLLLPEGTQKYTCLTGARSEGAEDLVSQAPPAKIVILGREEFKSNSLISQVMLPFYAFGRACSLWSLCISSSFKAPGQSSQ